MFFFWVVAGSLAAAAVALILFRAVGSLAATGAVDPAQVLYRRQLAEIDDLVERGLMGEAERKSAQSETGRRLLVASDNPAEIWNADPQARGPVLVAAAALPALTLAMYLSLGSPGMSDQGYATRLAKWQSSDLTTLTPPEIAAVLRQAVQDRPTEAEGYRLLGLAEDASQNPVAALQALRRAAQLASQRPEIWRMLGQAAFEKLLALEPDDPAARFFLAQAKAEAGQTKEAAVDLRALLADTPSDAEGRDAVQARLAELEGRPAPPSGDPEQLAMIRGMVDGLATKLKSNPDNADGWIRLIRAYAVLADFPRRDSAYAAARARYSKTPSVLQQLDEAARAEPMR